MWSCHFHHWVTPLLPPEYGPCGRVVSMGLDGRAAVGQVGVVPKVPGVGANGGVEVCVPGGSVVPSSVSSSSR